MSTPPRVFISYSHDSEDHKAWVHTLATDLMSNGVEVTLDQWDLALGQDLAMFMQQGIATSDRVLLVCSDRYVAKAEAGQGGVGFERLIVTKEVIESIETKKFIPVARGNASEPRTPNFLGPRLFANFNAETEYASRLDDLLREIHGVPRVPRPALGANPFSGIVSPSTQAPRVVGVTGRTTAGMSALDDQWFKDRNATALAGAENIGVPGWMSFRFALHEPIEKSQIELLDAVDSSTIRTFGWPIGICLRGDEAFSPRPAGDGVVAEIAIQTAEGGQRDSYDYWAIRKNGDFFQLQSLFEDQRKPGFIFFNTRIVRITESFMFMRRVCQKLGVPEETKFNMRFEHSGLKGRTLSAVGNRFIIENRKSYENSVASEITASLLEADSEMARLVKSIAAPLFTMFDFAEFGDDIYEDIVRRFQAGEVS